MICSNEVKKIHLIGICGTAMGNLAVGLKQSGYQVTGSDSEIYPPMSDFLYNNGIDVKNYSVENVKNKDLVIIGNAIPRGNIEAEYVLNNKIPYTSLPEALNYFFVKNKKLIMITGTHGKTTTSSLIAFILEYNKLNPSFLIGGIIPQLKTGFKYRKDSEYFVLEGDEYDTAFFDKTSKFLKFTPDYLVINYLEFDHGDIFENLKEIKKAFVHLLKKCPQNSTVFLNIDHKYTYNLRKYSYSKTKTFGFKQQADCSIKFLKVKEGRSIYRITANNKEFTVSSLLHGKHNGRNIAAAFGVCLTIGLTPEQIIAGINNFSGVERRFQIYYQNNSKKTILIHDFAHHPTSFKFAIQTAKSVYPDKKIIAIIEPGTNTIRSGKFNKKLKPLSNMVDWLIFLPIPEKKKHAITDNFSPPSGKNILNLKSVEEFEDFLNNNYFSNTVFLIMSNASPWKYISIVKKKLEENKNG